jgi:hypothetical protein
MEFSQLKTRHMFELVLYGYDIFDLAPSGKQDMFHEPPTYVYFY